MSWNRWASSVAAGLSRSLTVIATAGWRSPRRPGQRLAGGAGRLREGGGEVGADAHHLAGGAHLGPEQGVGAGEPRERQHRLLHRHHVGRRLAQPEVGDPVAERHPAGGLDQRHAGRLGDERDGARRARVRLDHEHLAVADRELHVHVPDDAEGTGQLARLAPHLRLDLVADREGRDHAGRVAGVDAGLLDVLHHRADQDVVAVGDRVDVDLDRVLDEGVDQRARARSAPPAASPRRSRCASRGPRARSSAAPAPGSRSRAPPRPPPRRRRRSPRPAPSGRSTSSSEPNRCRSSARSMAWNGVPRIGTPASIRRFASRSGVWPPNWITTPAGCSASITSSTSSIVSGSK